MTATIGSTGSTGSTPPVASTSVTDATTTKTAVPPGGELGKDAFLQLLVASMKYQDPSKPVDSQQYIAQLAQFTQVEKLNEISSSQSDLTRWQRTISGQGMLGDVITGHPNDTLTSSSQEVVTGTVVLVTPTSTGAKLTLSTGRTVDIADVLSVATPGTPTPPATPAPTGSSSTGSSGTGGRSTGTSAG